MKKKFIYIGVFIGLVLLIGGAYFLLTESKTETETDKTAETNQSEIIVYETEVADESECTSYELFDAENSICYFECENEQECSELEQAVDHEYEELLKTIEEGSGVSEESQPSDETEFSARYDVSANETLTHTTGEDATEFRTLWSSITLLSPDTLSNQYIEEFVIYEDAEDDTLAYVVDDDADGKWQYGINFATHSQSTKAEQTSTLIHELAHIITLNSSQISADAENCASYQTDEGCALPSSYLNAFVGRFWDEKEQSFDPTIFVTEYAATNPEEDMAESFAYFVLSNETDTSVVKNQKIRFFADYQELVTIRNEMRTAVARNVIRERRAN